MTTDCLGSLGRQLPQPAQHVDRIEKPVGELDPPGEGVPRPARPHLASSRPRRFPVSVPDTSSATTPPL